MSIRPETYVRNFWARVNKTDSCWVWQGAKSNRGYGVTKPKGVIVRAHRYAYELLVAPIPKGMVIDHLCKNKLCVNPQHLEPVTPSINSIREFPFAKKRICNDCMQSISDIKNKCMELHKEKPRG